MAVPEDHTDRANSDYANQQAQQLPTTNDAMQAILSQMQSLDFNPTQIITSVPLGHTKTKNRRSKRYWHQQFGKQRCCKSWSMIKCLIRTTNLSMYNIKIS